MIYSLKIWLTAHSYFKTDHKNELLICWSKNFTKTTTTLLEFFFVSRWTKLSIGTKSTQFLVGTIVKQVLTSSKQLRYYINKLSISKVALLHKHKMLTNFLCGSLIGREKKHDWPIFFFFYGCSVELKILQVGSNELITENVKLCLNKWKE